MIRNHPDNTWVENILFGSLEKAERQAKRSLGIMPNCDPYPSLCPGCPNDSRWFTIIELYAICKHFKSSSAKPIEINVKSAMYVGWSSYSLLEKLRSLFRDFHNKRYISYYKFKRVVLESSPDSGMSMLDSTIDTIEEIEDKIFRENSFIIEISKDGSSIMKFKINQVHNHMSATSMSDDQVWAQQGISYCPVCSQSFLDGEPRPLTPNDDRLPMTLIPRVKIDIKKEWTILDVLEAVELQVTTKVPILGKIVNEVRTQASNIWPRSFARKDIREDIKKIFNRLTSSDKWFEAGKALINLGLGIKPSFVQLTTEERDEQLDIWENLYNLIDSQIDLNTPKLRTASLLFSVANQCISINTYSHTSGIEDYGEQITYLLAMPSDQDAISEAFSLIFEDEPDIQIISTQLCEFMFSRGVAENNISTNPSESSTFDNDGEKDIPEPSEFIGGILINADVNLEPTF